MTVDLHVVQDHLGLTVEGLAAVGAQVFLQHNPDPHETSSQRIHMKHEKSKVFEGRKGIPDIRIRRKFPSAFGVFSKLIIEYYIRVPEGGLGIDRIRQQLF